MESAKDIAKDMLNAIHIEHSGFLQGVAKGFISFPVSMGYLGYDFIDTDHRRENEDDKFRIARLIKKGVYRREFIERAIAIFINYFTSRVDINRVENFAENTAGSVIGKMVFAQLSGVNLGAAITTGAVSSFLSGLVFGTLIYFGAETSRAIYTSRDLGLREPAIYDKLRNAGDLDLLYFAIEDTVKPFEKACDVSKSNPEKFNEICDYFFGGL